MHHRAALVLLTLEQVHYGHTEAVIDQRNTVLAAAYAAPFRTIRPKTSEGGTASTRDLDQQANEANTAIGTLIL